MAPCGDNRSRKYSPAGGFSLLEMMIVVVVLMLVFGVVVKALQDMQQRNTSEDSKMDTVQETRDFIDQMVRDVHDVGYPPGRVVNGNPTCVGNAGIACGITSFSSTQIIYEGDLDGTGTIYQVTVQLLAPASQKCPCILQRGVVTKAQALGGQVPTYFTEVNGTINSGNGAGAATYTISLSGPGSYTTYSTADLFDAYDVNASPVGACASSVACSSIRSLQITANVVPSGADPVTHMFPVFSITSKARLNF